MGARRDDSGYHDKIHQSLIVAKGAHLRARRADHRAPHVAARKIGGVRNWDYRYCWLRDATLTLHGDARRRIDDEAIAWHDWLLRAVAGDPADIQIMYGIGGERRLFERELDWLPGYEGSKPVRIGNGAADQFQLDVYGDVIDACTSASCTARPPTPPPGR